MTDGDMLRKIAVLEAIAKAARDEGVDSPASYRISDRVMLSGVLGRTLASDIAASALNALSDEVDA